jgi:magnesium chelatase family protein
MRAGEGGEPSANIRARVEDARARQRRRLEGGRALTNAEMSDATARATCTLSAKAENALLELARRRGGVTARGLDRMLRVARTIADLEGEDIIGIDAIHEAAMYRAYDVDQLADPRALAMPQVSGPAA